jgi:serine protease Do
VTVGVVSGKDRAFSSQECQYVCSGLLQTDASINPGNSGGALLNLDGELVGVNLAVVQDAQNIGFAVPVDKVIRLFKTIK